MTMSDYQPTPSLSDDGYIAEIVANPTPEKRAEAQAEAAASGELLCDVVGHTVYWINILGSQTEISHLINIGYVGTDSELRDFTAAMAAHNRPDHSELPVSAGPAEVAP